MNDQKVQLSTIGWLKVAKKDWDRIHYMLEKDDAIIYDPNLKSFYDLCERVSGYYFADRYPPLRTTDITCEDITKYLEEAQKFIKALFPEEELNV